MPFTAIDKASGTTINIVLMPRSATLLIKPRSVVCPNCEQDMSPKCGFIKIPHFAHMADQQLCNGPFKSHPESRQHLSSKWWLYHKLAKATAADSAEIFMEYRVPACGRIADLMVVYPSGMKHAHEAQLASLGVRELEERTSSYHKEDIDVTWWLGGAAATQSNIEFLEETTKNFVGSIVFEKITMNLEAVNLTETLMTSEAGDGL